MKSYSNTHETRIALLEQSIDHIDENLKNIDKRFDKIDAQFEKIDRKFERIDDQFSELRKESKNQFRWTLGTIITLFSLPIIQNIITHFWSH